MMTVGRALELVCKEAKNRVVGLRGLAVLYDNAGEPNTHAKEADELDEARRFVEDRLRWTPGAPLVNEAQIAALVEGVRDLQKNRDSMVTFTDAQLTDLLVILGAYPVTANLVDPVEIGILKHPDGWWLSIATPGGKQAMINLGAVGIYASSDRMPITEVCLEEAAKQTTQRKEAEWPKKR